MMDFIIIVDLFRLGLKPKYSFYLGSILLSSGILSGTQLGGRREPAGLTADFP